MPNAGAMQMPVTPSPSGVKTLRYFPAISARVVQQGSLCDMDSRSLLQFRQRTGTVSCSAYWRPQWQQIHLVRPIAELFALRGLERRHDFRLTLRMAERPQGIGCHVLDRGKIRATIADAHVVGSGANVDALGLGMLHHVLCQLP